MNYYEKSAVKYYMSKKKSIILVAIMLAVCIAVPIMATFRSNKGTDGEEKCQMTYLTVWQIDGFEGGKGSRAQYLTNIGERCFKDENIYVRVTALSAEMARENMKQGLMPDMISYPAGFYGLENYMGNADFVQTTWCNGSYCMLTLDENADFSDATAENTVVNEGKDNLTAVTVALSGLNGAKFEQPTNAYLNLINGKYKYLLGTQRDIFRLKTRGVTYKVKPITIFNDLYQCVAIMVKNAEKASKCSRYINFLQQKGDVSALGLFGASAVDRADGLEEFDLLNFESKINTMCSEAYINELKEHAKSNEINKIKNLLK